MSKRQIGALEAVMGLIGCVLLTYGIGQWSTPGGYVTAGVLLLGIAVWPSKAEKVTRS